MLEALRVFIIGFILWWVAFGFAYFNSGLFGSVKTKYLKILVAVGTPIALILLIVHSNIAYGFFASFIGGAWGILHHRKYRNNLVPSSRG